MVWNGNENNAKTVRYHLGINVMVKPKIIVDSNILIYSYKPEFAWLQQQLFEFDLYASAISKVESLGYHQLLANDKVILEQIFAVIDMLPVNYQVIEKAIDLKQQKKMSLGDSIIASTALIYQLPLMTRNVSDFAWIDRLEIINPFDE